MKRLLTVPILTVFLAGVNLFAQTPSDGIVVPAGATAKLALRSAISSKLNEPGDRIKAVLEEEVLDPDGLVVIPTGTEFIGRITQMQAARRMQREASMTIVFESMWMPYGVEKISTVVTAIDDYAGDNKLKAKTGEGKVEGGRSVTRTGRNMATGGTVGGLLGIAGTISGGGYKPIPIGLDIGIVGGVLVTKGNEIRLGPETTLRIRFERPVTLPEQFVK